MIRRVVVVALASLPIVLLLAWFGYARHAIPSGVGLAAKHLCSLVYVSKLEPDFARSLYVDPFVQPMSRFLTVRYGDGTVTARGFARWRASALHRPGLGCTLRHDAVELARAPTARAAGVPLPRREIPSEARERIDAALEAAFEDPDGGRHTLAVVVVHDGALVAERYASGVRANTPLPGWSMSKSVTATLAGLRVRDGALDLDAPGAIGEWRGRDDPRSAIALDHLLRMTSGLEITEDQTGADPNSEMLFRVPDAAAFAAARPLRAAPGTRYEYMSGNTILAARAIAESLGGGRAAMSAYARERLLGPLGMGTAVLEFDAAGTYVGSSFTLASASDWAKLGLLHLNGGRVGGEPILPDGWIEYVTRHTAAAGDAGYGAGWWINSGPRPIWPSLPRDTFAARGWQGQTTFVIPSERLVVVRMGASTGRTGVEALVAGVVDALASDPASSRSER